MLTLSGHDLGTPGGSSAGQTPSLSFTSLSPGGPAKPWPAFAQPRWPPRIYKKIRYRNKRSSVPFPCEPTVAGLGPRLQGGGRSDRWGRCFTRVAQRGSGRGTAAGGGGTRRLPHGLPPVSREGPAHASERSGRRVRLDGAKPGGKETPGLSPADQPSFERGARLSQLIPDWGTPRNPAASAAGPQREAQTHAEIPFSPVALSALISLSKQVSISYCV